MATQHMDTYSLVLVSRLCRVIRYLYVACLDAPDASHISSTQPPLTSYIISTPEVNQTAAKNQATENKKKEEEPSLTFLRRLPPYRGIDNHNHKVCN